LDNGRPNEDYASLPAIWKNGEKSVLPFDRRTRNAYASLVLVHGDDVYIAGTWFGSALFWKNGVLQELPHADPGLCKAYE
jgi:hypothetical protein